MFKVNNRNTRTRCKIGSKLTIKTPGAFTTNFEHISHLSSVSSVKFDQVSADWGFLYL